MDEVKITRATLLSLKKEIEDDLEECQRDRKVASSQYRELLDGQINTLKRVLKRLKLNYKI